VSYVLGNHAKPIQGRKHFHTVAGKGCLSESPCLPVILFGLLIPAMQHAKRTKADQTVHSQAVCGLAGWLAMQKPQRPPIQIASLGVITAAFAGGSRSLNIFR
jgi:hypothetical protein